MIKDGNTSLPLPGLEVPKSHDQGHLDDREKNATNGIYYISRYRLGKVDFLKMLKAAPFKDISSDSYLFHKIIYNLFPFRKDGIKNRILYCDKGPGRHEREIIVIANQKPEKPAWGEIETREISPAFFDYPRYRFAMTINPTIRNPANKKIEPVKGRPKIAEWFLKKAPAWGFEIDPNSLQVIDVKVDQFEAPASGKDEKKRNIVLEKARVTGILTITDKKRFAESVYNGIGRGKAFGCGLLQISPIKFYEDRN